MAPGDGGFADSLADLAAVVQSSAGLGHAAEHVLAMAQANLECDHAGITYCHRDGRLESLAVTAPVVAEAARLQHDYGEGPCVDVLTEHRDFAVDDLGSDPRWPRWVRLRWVSG